MNEERKYEKKVNTHGWMAKIQYWAFGIEAEKKYIGYCPFFWMTWVCILCSPFILAGKILGSVFGFAGETIFYVSSKAKAVKPKKVKPENPRMFIPNVRERMTMFYSERDRREHGGAVTDCRLDFYKDWVALNPNWYEAIEAALAAKQEQEIKQKAFDKKKEEYLTKFSNVVRLLVKPALLLSIPLAAFIVYKLAFWLAVTIPWLPIGKFVLEKGLLIVGVLVGLWAIKYFFQFIGHIFGLLKNVVDKEEKQTYVVPVEREPGPIANFFMAVFEGIGAFFGFIKETIKITYKQECPLIQWGDKSGKIQKRKNSEPFL